MSKKNVTPWEIECQHALAAHKERLAGKTVCSSCNAVVTSTDLVNSVKLKLEEGLAFDGFFCRDCSTYCQELENSLGEKLIQPGNEETNLSEDEKSDRRATRLQAGEEILSCSFCRKDEFDMKSLFALQYFYKVFETNGSYEVCMVAPKGFERVRFFAQVEGRKIEKIASLHICGKCVLGE